MSRGKQRHISNALRRFLCNYVFIIMWWVCRAACRIPCRRIVMGGTVSSWSVTSKVEVHHIHHILGQLWLPLHYSDVIISTMVSQFTSLMIVYSTVYSGTDQRKHQSSTSLTFVRGIHRWLVNSPHKGPVSRKMFPFDKVIMVWAIIIMIFSKALSVSPCVFSAANLALAGFPLNNALCESMPSRH